jgi:transcriptional regulator with XRE-family HTH domain
MAQEKKSKKDRKKKEGTKRAAKIKNAESAIEVEDPKELTIKQEIGKRFRRFRETIRKAQHELASELDIYQSTITNIERGKTFPNIKYLQHFYHKYDLNVNWLLTNQGDMIIYHYRTNPNALSVMDCHLAYNDPKYELYADLLNYMQVPEVEQLILARLTEAKALFKEQINDYFDNQAKKSTDK